MNLSNLIESLSTYRARSLHTSLAKTGNQDQDINSIDNTLEPPPVIQPPRVVRGLLQNGDTTPSSHQLDSIESFSEAISKNNDITTEIEADETTNLGLRIRSRYLHVGRCGCFACSFSRDLLETDRASNTELNNSISKTSPTIDFGTLNELSDYLTTGFWEQAGGFTNQFNLGGSGLGAKSGQLTYNITGWANDLNGLSAERQALTREVFKVYETITDIKFVEVITDGDIRFTDNDSGAYAYLGDGWWEQDPNTGLIDYNAAITDYSVVNVASSWFYGDSSYNGYTPQTIFHEIGHALGLGHQGLYNAGNGNPTYENSAQYGNDTWLTTMMSYWSQTTNTNVNSSFAYLQTPMTVDWIALDKLYGSQGYGSFNAFNGNTVYGVGTNISSDTSEIMNNFATMIGQTAYTLIDGSGYDILNVSNYSDDQFINLAPSELNGTLPSSSSIGGLVNNLTIGVNTILEEAIGGSGNDTFIGNIADNVFKGGSGGDTFYDSFGSDTYYGGSGSFDTLYFSENFSDFSIENLDSSLAFSRNNSSQTDTDLIWNDIELVYFNDDVVKTYKELVSEITSDITSPTLSISDNISGIATGDITFSFEFSEAVSGFTADDISISSNASKGSFSGSDGDHSYTLIISPESNSTGTITVDVNADAATDSAGNGNSAVTQASQAFNTRSTFAEYGQLSLNHNWQSVSLDNSYINPVVIVSDPTFNGGDPVAVRLRGIGSSSFQIRLQEPNYLDGAHINETLSYLVVEAGEWELADGTRLSAGTTSSNKLSSAGFESLSFSNSFSSTPTVLSQVQTFAGSDWVVTRTKEINANGFQLAMQEEEQLNDGAHANETIGWLAVESGSASDGSTSFQAATTANSYTNSTKALSFSSPFSSAPSLLAKLDSFNGTDTANLRISSLSTSGFNTRVYEEQSRDSEIDHITESLAYLALDGSSGFLTGSSYSPPSDTTSPTLSISDNISGIATGDITFSFEFSEAVSGFTADDISISSNASKGSFSGSDGDHSYTLIISPESNSTGTITVDVNADAATDDSITGNELETFSGSSGMTNTSKEALDEIESLSSYLTQIEDLLDQSPEKATEDWLIRTQGLQDQGLRTSKLGVFDAIPERVLNTKNGISNFSVISALEPTHFIAQALDSLYTNLS